jgi:hypothetical protein
VRAAAVVPRRLHELDAVQRPGRLRVAKVGEEGEAIGLDERAAFVLWNPVR